MAMLGLLCHPTAFGQSSAAQITSPVPGTVLSGSSASFTWSAGTSVTAYWLYLGTTGPQSANLYSSGAIAATSVTVTGLPTNGVTIYATLFSEISGTWTPEGYTYTEAGTPVLAAMISPAAGSALSGASATFTWSAGAGPTAYWLYVGTTGPKSTNLYDAGGTGVTSATVTGIPTSGNPVYVTLFSQIDGAWQPVAYVYTEESTGPPAQATMVTPANGSVLSGSTVTFTWTAGSQVSGYDLYVGTTGAQSANIYNSHQIGGTSVTVSGVPADGVNLYVTLFSLINGSWESTSYTYTEAGTISLAAMTSPAPGTTLLGSSVKFTWSAGAGPTAYWLYIGTTAGAANLYNSGGLTSTSVTAAGLPTDGVAIYVTLFSKINGAFQPVHYTYTAASPPALAAMTSPTSGSTLSGSSVTFNWTAGSQVTAYWLYIGTTGAKSANIYNSGQLSGTSVTVSGIPAYGVTVYVTLFSQLAGVFQPVSYTYTESGSPVLAAMTSPPCASTLLDSTQTFNWSAGGGATAYWLYVGTSAGAANLFDSGGLTTTSVSAAGLPMNGSTIYVTLFSEINGVYKPVSCSFAGAVPEVDLSWNTESDIAGYNVYRATSGGSDYQQVNTSLVLNPSSDPPTVSYTDNSVSAGVTYDYYVESVNSDGLPSLPSTIYAIPIPTFLN